MVTEIKVAITLGEVRKLTEMLEEVLPEREALGKGLVRDNPDSETGREYVVQALVGRRLVEKMTEALDDALEKEAKKEGTAKRVMERILCEAEDVVEGQAQMKIGE